MGISCYVYCLCVWASIDAAVGNIQGDPAWLRIARKQTDLDRLLQYLLTLDLEFKSLVSCGHDPCSTLPANTVGNKKQELKVIGKLQW